MAGETQDKGAEGAAAVAAGDLDRTETKTTGHGHFRTVLWGGAGNKKKPNQTQGNHSHRPHENNAPEKMLGAFIKLRHVPPPQPIWPLRRVPRPGVGPGGSSGPPGPPALPSSLAAGVPGPHLAGSSRRFFPKMCFDLIGLCKSLLSWGRGRKNMTGGDKPLAETTATEKSGDRVQVAKNNQPKKRRQREHKILINAQLSIISMQQYGLFLTDENTQSYFYLKCICCFEHQLHISSLKKPHSLLLIFPSPRVTSRTEPFLPTYQWHEQSVPCEQVDQPKLLFPDRNSIPTFLRQLR